MIPARGGSRSIPRKNIVPLSGRPLLAYTCQAALLSKRLTRTILSTDDEEIASVGRACGVEAPFLRPQELAQDATPVIEVLAHALRWVGENDRIQPDLLVLLQPTSPFRRAEHIDSAVALLEETGADTVVSVVEVPHQYNPASLMQLNDGRLTNFLRGPQILRRQDKPRVYARNGPAVLVIKSSLVREGILYGPVCRPLVMDRADSIDIDEPLDLVIAECLLEKGRDSGGR